MYPYWHFCSFDCENLKPMRAEKAGILYTPAATTADMIEGKYIVSVILRGARAPYPKELEVNDPNKLNW